MKTDRLVIAVAMSLATPLALFPSDQPSAGVPAGRSDFANVFEFFSALRLPLKQLAHQIDRDRLEKHLKRLGVNLGEMADRKGEIIRALEKTPITSSDRESIRKKLTEMTAKISEISEDIRGLAGPFDAELKNKANSAEDELRGVLEQRKSWKDQLLADLSWANDEELRKKLAPAKASLAGLNAAKAQMVDLAVELAKKE